jgi:hypothetical protein
MVTDATVSAPVVVLKDRFAVAIPVRALKYPPAVFG